MQHQRDANEERISNNHSRLSSNLEILISQVFQTRNCIIVPPYLPVCGQRGGDHARRREIEKGTELLVKWREKKREREE